MTSVSRMSRRQNVPVPIINPECIPRSESHAFRVSCESGNP
jgi:hypothetical protein